MMIVDRIEDGVAVIETENGSFIHIDATLLPHGAREGWVLAEVDGVLTRDAEAEDRRKAMLFAMQKKMFGRDKT